MSFNIKYDINTFTTILSNIFCFDNPKILKSINNGKTWNIVLGDEDYDFELFLEYNTETDNIKATFTYSSKEFEFNKIQKNIIDDRECGYITEELSSWTEKVNEEFYDQIQY